jgi:hypothetical protein
MRKRCEKTETEAERLAREWIARMTSPEAERTEGPVPLADLSGPVLDTIAERRQAQKKATADLVE